MWVIFQKKFLFFIWFLFWWYTLVNCKPPSSLGDLSIFCYILLDFYSVPIFLISVTCHPHLVNCKPLLGVGDNSFPFIVSFIFQAIFTLHQQEIFSNNFVFLAIIHLFCIIWPTTETDFHVWVMERAAVKISNNTFF